MEETVTFNLDEGRSFGVISSALGNIYGLEAVLKELKADGCEQICCLGGIVGFAPWPNECCEIARSFSVLLRAGIDSMCVEEDLPKLVGSPNRLRLIDWTMGQLPPEFRCMIKQLPTRVETPSFLFRISHIESKTADGTSCKCVFDWPAEFSYTPFLLKPDAGAPYPDGMSDMSRKSIAVAEVGRRIVFPGCVTDPGRLGVAHYALVRDGTIFFRSVRYDGDAVFRELCRVPGLSRSYLDAIRLALDRTSSDKS